jgi:hypothetical protein
MATPVVTPNSTQLHPISIYLKAHERLIIIVLLSALAWFTFGKVESVIAAHDSSNLQQAKVVASVQQEKNDATAALVAQQAAQYQSLAEKVQLQNAQLEQANVALSAALAKQQKTDAGLPLPDLANRWTVLVPQAKPTATATGLAVDTPGAVATVQQLELVPVQQQKLTAAQAEIRNDLGLLTVSTQQVATLDTQVTGLQLQLVDNAKVCTAQIAVVKAQAVKRSRFWFKVGFALGFVTRQAIPIPTGL